MTTTETVLKFHKMMAGPMLLYGNGSLTVKSKYWMRLQATEMEFISSVKVCSKIEG
jgi:hypothetical protein